MMVRLRHYLASLLLLSLIAIGYRATVAPWLEPPGMEVIGLGDDPILQSDESIQDLFSENAWQRGTCKQLQTADGVLLFQSWEQVENDQWRLWPVTVVIGRGMSGGVADTPIILEAEQGAEIKFTESLDVMSGGAPPIQRGRMIGQVYLHRPGDREGQDALEIQTSNVGIDSQKIWTTEAIEMQVGKARLLGRDLTIHLDGPSNAATGKAKAPTVLDRMELIYLDELVMPLEGGSLWKSVKDSPETESDEQLDSAGRFGESGVTSRLTDQDSGGLSADSKAIEPSALISLTCGGRVEYDFALDHLSLRDSVSLVHQVSGQLSDRFDCDSIRLILNDPTNQQLERTSPMDWLVGVVATGTPVVAKLPSFDTDLAAERIELNVQEGVIQAQGSKGIEIRRGSVTARLARINYRFDSAHPEVLGALDAPGAGILNFDDPDIPIRRAQWRGGVKLQPSTVEWSPDGETIVSVSPAPGNEPMDSQSVSASDDTLELGAATTQESSGRSQVPDQIEVWLDGDITAMMSDGGEFKANSIAGLLHASELPDSDGGSSYVPDRFEISGEVKIDTGAIAASAEKVLLFFVEESVDGVASDASSGISPLRQWVVQPSGSGQLVDPISRPRPSISGESIRAQLALRGSQIDAKKLSVMGNVEVVHHLKTGNQMLATKLTGDHLQLIDGGGDDVLQLTSTVGNPARFELGDGYFVGPQIQIRPGDNLIWMNAAGEFQMPTAALPSTVSETGDVAFIWSKAPYCRWQGEMIFDGRTAVLTDGVDLEASLVHRDEFWDILMSGDRLQIDLTNSIEVRNVKAMRQAAIRSISLMQTEERPVVVEAFRRGGDGVMEARHMLRASLLRLQPDAGGVLVGEGPGWYRGWVVPKPDQPLLSTKQEDSPKSMDLNQRSITGAHLVFYETLQAAFAGRKLEFTGGIRIGVRPVENWKSIFDAQEMDAISAGESTLDCDRLLFNLEPQGPTLSRVAGLSTPWEMEANDDVVFRTRNDQGLLEGTASRASYSSSKDLFTVEGAPNRAAVFRQTRPDGSPGPEGAVRTMTIRPGTMKVENAVIERLNIGAPASR